MARRPCVVNDHGDSVNRKRRVVVTEERLGGGGGTAGVVRVGATVRRPAGPWTPTVHAYLQHIRAAGFTAAPEVLGMDERGREILSYLEGETWGDGIDPDEPKSELVTVRPWPERTRSDETLAEIGRLYARLHRASRGFRPASPTWREYEIPMRKDEIVCHGDPGPWNIVFRGATPVGIIDWDGARPNTALGDLAIIAWHFIPLGPDAFLRACGFDASFRTGERLRLLCDAYGLAERSSIVPALSLVKQQSAMSLRYWQPLRPGAGANWLRALVNDLDWLETNAAALRASLE